LADESVRKYDFEMIPSRKKPGGQQVLLRPKVDIPRARVVIGKENIVDLNDDAGMKPR